MAFWSLAPDLVPNDTNGWSDVFVHDRANRTTTKVTQSPAGHGADGPSGYPSISADGRYIAFLSFARNLTEPPVPNKVTSVYVHDREIGETTLASVAPDGSNAIAYSPAISGDGRHVSFVAVGQLFGGDDGWDHFIRDLDDDLAIRIPCGDQYVTARYGNPGSLSYDGRFFAYSCPLRSTGEHELWTYESATGESTLVAGATSHVSGDEDSSHPWLSADGRSVAFHSLNSDLVPGDTNGTWDIFVYNRDKGSLARVSVNSRGEQATHRAVISSGGQPRLSGASVRPSISADGRRITFQSYASNLVDDDVNLSTDTFVHDLDTRCTVRASQSSDHHQGFGDSSYPAISGDGRTVVFQSDAPNLVPNDTNGYSDVFAHDLPDEITCPSLLP